MSEELSVNNITMRNKLGVWLSLILVAAMGFGCTTPSGGGPYLTPEKVERSVDVLVGTFSVVRQKSHPDSKPAFVKARDSLSVLVANEKWDVGAFGEVLASTGMLELAGDDIVLYISTGVTVINLATADRIDLSKVEYAKALIVGGSKALDRTVK